MNALLRPALARFHGAIASRPGAAAQLACFRMLAALLLAATCWSLSVRIGAAELAPYDGPPLAIGAVVRTWLAKLPPALPFQVGALVALATALGPYARVAAAALVLGAGQLVLSVPASARFDLSAIAFVALWLVLLPQRTREPELSPFLHRLVLIHLALLYANPSLWRAGTPAWGPGFPPAVLAALLPALLLLASSRRARLLAGLLQLTLHGLLAVASEAGLAAALLGSTVCLVTFRPTPSATVVDAGTAAAVGLTAVAALFVLARLLGAGLLMRSSGQLLADLGLVFVYAL